VQGPTIAAEYFTCRAYFFGLPGLAAKCKKIVTGHWGDSQFATTPQSASLDCEEQEVLLLSVVGQQNPCFPKESGIECCGQGLS